MSSPLTIHLATPADRLGVVACVHEAYQPYVARIGQPPAPMHADYAELIARREVHVLKEAGEPADVATRRVLAILVMRSVGAAMFIENVAVRPEYQRRGLGRRMMAYAEEAARAAGLSELRLYTNELMVENIAFYGRLGYVETERRIDAGFRRVFMLKTLAQGK